MGKKCYRVHVPIAGRAVYDVDACCAAEALDLVLGGNVAQVDLTYEFFEKLLDGDVFAGCLATARSSRPGIGRCGVDSCCWRPGWRYTPTEEETHMSKKCYLVHIPLAGRVVYSVEACCAEEALDRALEGDGAQVDLTYEVHEKLVDGNVFAGDLNEAYAEEEDG